MSSVLAELRNKDQVELRSLLASKQHELRGLKAKALAQDLKGVRTVRALRREVAQLMTILNQAARQSARKP